MSMISNSFLSGRLSINGQTIGGNSTPTQNNLANLSAGLRINGQSPVQNEVAPGGSTDVASSSSAIQNNSAATSSSENSGTISERFAAKMLERCQKEMAKRPASKQNPDHAQLMADALQMTAKDIGERFGNQASNDFMSQILSVTDEKVDEKGLVSAIQSFFSILESSQEKTGGIPGGVSRLGGYTMVLNQGSDALIVDDTTNTWPNSVAPTESGPSNTGFEGPGVAYAMNLFFGLVSKDEAGPTYKNFDMNFNWFTESRKPIEIGSYNSVTASELLSSEAPGDMANYLINVADCENAANYISGLQKGSNFMDAIGTAVSIVLMEKGQRTAEYFVAYLNSNLKSAVNEIHSGDTFHGWRLGRDRSKPYDGLGSSQFEPNDFWFGSAEISEKNHVGLTTKWTVDANGIGCYDTVDMNEIYDKYLKMNKPQTNETDPTVAAQTLNEAKGNLVDQII